jgi:hypothetical protein
LLDVVEALVIGGKLLCDVYELHGLGFLLRHITTVSITAAMIGNRNVNSIKLDYINSESVSSA